MTKPTAESLVALAQALVDTENEEIDCDQFLEQVATYAEAERAAGADPSLQMAAVEQHLRICPTCHEEFLILKRALEPASEES